MASVARAIEQAASSKVEETLWWDCHESLFQLVDDFLSGSRKLTPNQVAENLRVNHVWLLDSVSRFRQPNAKSRSALDDTQVVIGDHKVDINCELKIVALEMSKQLMLDEVQSYILASRCFDGDEAPSLTKESFQKVSLKYYTERQCLLKCIRLLLLSQMGDPTFKILEMEVDSLVREGLENKLLAALKMLLTAEQPLDMDMTYVSLWAEQIVREGHLVLDAVFILYFNPIQTCSFTRWKDFFVLFKEKVFVGTNLDRFSLTVEAMTLIDHLKHQCLLIMLGTLDLDKLLLMVHENLPFSDGRHLFVMSDLQQIDELVGELDAMEVQDYAPLLLGWGIFGCLLSFLPKSDTHALDLNHTLYTHRAYEAGAFKHILQMLTDKGMQETPVDGYKFVIKSLISTFVAAYDISSQNDTAAMDIIIDILKLVHSGQEMLCIEFWDRENILDGPLRNLLSFLRKLFPFKMKNLVLFLAGLATGSWPAECVYEFLCKPAEITCAYDNTTDASNCNDQIIATMAVAIPKVSGLFIPPGTAGQCLKTLDDQKCLVLWNCKHSAVVILLLHTVELIGTGDAWEEIHAIIYLLHCIVANNKMLAKELLNLNQSEFCEEARSDGRMGATISIDILVVLHLLSDKLLDVPGHNATAALCICMFGVFTDCCPLKAILELKKPLPVWSCNALEDDLLTKLLSNIFQDFSGSAGKQLLVAILDLCLPMLRKGCYSEGLCNIVMHIIGTLFLIHVTWKYEEKYECWQITAKIFELACMVVSNPHPSLSQLSASVLSFIIADGAFHDVMIKVLSVDIADIQGLYFNRFVEPLEIQWFEAVVTQGFLLVHRALSIFSASCPILDVRSNTPLEHVLLHHNLGTMPFVVCVASLVGYFHNQAIQIASLKVLKLLCIAAGKALPQALTISSYFQGAELKQQLQTVMGKLLSKESIESDTELLDHSLELLKTAAIYQPSFLNMLLLPIKGPGEIDGRGDDGSIPSATEDTECGSIAFESIWNILSQQYNFFESKPKILAKVILFLRSLWRGGSELSDLLEVLRKQPAFWTILTSFVSNTPSVLNDLEELSNRCFQYQCQSYALQIMTCELFLQREHPFETRDVKSDHTDKQIKHGKSQKTKSGVVSSVVQILQASDPTKLMQSFAVPHYDKLVAQRAKAEIRILLVGLMLKVLLEDNIGLSTTILKSIQDALGAVFSHSSFQKLSTTYSSQGYGCGRELYVLVISDLYYHLQGELEAGRHIPVGLFEDLVQFLDALDTIHILTGKQQTVVEGLSFQRAWTYDIEMINSQLGLEWWSENSYQVAQTAKNALHALKQANLMTYFGCSHISALEALTSLFTFLISDRQMAALEINLTSKSALIMEVCSSIETTIKLLGPDGDPTHLLQTFSSMQMTLLVGLLRWLLNSVKDESASVHAEKWCPTVVSSIVQAVKSISCLQKAEDTRESQLIRSSLTAYLCCLELLQAQNDRTLSQGNILKLANDHDSPVILDTTSSCAEFLPHICCLVESKCHTNLAISVISILINHFLPPKIWLPILQRHSTVEHALSLLHDSEDTEGAFQVLNLLLTLSNSSGGVDMLQSANAFSYLLMFTEKLKEELMWTDKHEHFSMWSKRTRTHNLWGLAAAIVASFVQALGENAKEEAVEIGFAFLDSQKEQMLYALHPPKCLNAETEKMKRCKNSETTLAALQEAHQVLHVLAALMRYHTKWSQIMGASEELLARTCIQLLAYIAREGLMRNATSTVKGGFHCYPITKEEFRAQKVPSCLNITGGWFGLSAKGVGLMDKLSAFEANNELFLGLSPRMSSAHSQTDRVLPTCYSDSVALYMYRISLLLLEILYKQAHQISVSIYEGRTHYYKISQELPAPEILHSLQDQVMAILNEICCKGTPAIKKVEVQQVCRVLFLILEKALALETFVTRICRLGSLSLRTEDFLRDYKALLIACEGHKFLDACLRSLKPVVSVAFPLVS